MTGPRGAQPLRVRVNDDLVLEAGTCRPRSAALAERIDLYRRQRGGGLYVGLVERAVRHLPMPRRMSTPRLGPLSPLDLRSSDPRAPEGPGSGEVEGRTCDSR